MLARPRPSVSEAVASAQVRRQVAMVGYINAFHLLTLAPLLAAPLALFFRKPAPDQ